MTMLQCENCGSVFILNELHKLVYSGDYGFMGDVDCALCHCTMYPADNKVYRKDEQASETNYGQRYYEVTEG
jgi:hypothetical protein